MTKRPKDEDVAKAPESGETTSAESRTDAEWSQLSQREKFIRTAREVGADETGGRLGRGVAGGRAGSEALATNKGTLDLTRLSCCWLAKCINAYSLTWLDIRGSSPASRVTWTGWI
jgi:hypothetical protein